MKPQVASALVALKANSRNGMPVPRAASVARATAKQRQPANQYACRRSPPSSGRSVNQARCAAKESEPATMIPIVVQRIGAS